ncbi:MAG: BlaI/MecI/CopY family transcriptional regulator [Cyclobacteriaceae bacterium]
MKQLTQAEEEIMQILWQLKEAFVKEIVEKFEEPKPAYNTVSTLIRILEKKGFVGYQAFGKSHRYYPLIKKEEYSKKYLNRFVDNYFSGSYEQLVSFFTKQEKMDINDLEKLLNELKSKKS